MKQLLVLFLLSTGILSIAQEYPIKKIAVEALTIDDGLSQGMINGIIQDRYRFMWFATKDGLNRYDGYNFVVYRHRPNDKTSLADNFVTSVFEDSKGRLWVGTATKGLDLFNRETETFTHFQRDSTKKGTLAANSVCSIAEDAGGTIYVGTALHINIAHEIHSGVKDSFYFESFYTSRFPKLFPVSAGQLWMTHSYGPMMELTTNGKGRSFVDTVDGMKYRFSRRRYFDNPFVELFIPDTLHKSVYLVLMDGITRYDLAKKTFTRIDTSLYINYAGFSGAIDKTGLLWMPDDYKLLLFDPESKITWRLQPEDPQQEQMINLPTCVYRDRSGNMWIGTKGYGILKYNAKAGYFHKTDKGSITFMNTDNEGRIIVVKGKAYGSVFNNNKTAVVNTLPDTGSLIPSRDMAQAEAIIQDKDGSFWMGKNMLLHYDAGRKSYDYYKTDWECAFPLEDDNNGNLWMGTNYSLACFNKQSKQFTFYSYPDKNENMPYRYIQAIRKHNDSTFWVGTINGLLKFNRNNGSWKKYRNNPNDNASLSFDLIFSLCPDPVNPARYLWIGTNGGGLNRLDMTTNKFTHYSTKDGLPNDVIYGILSDDDGNLWMSTNKGLSQFDPVGNTFHNYEARDGLQDNEFNRYAYCKGKDGTLFFGGINGFNYFNPRELQLNSQPPNVVITNLRIANKPVAVNAEDGILKKALYLTDKVVLNYKDNMISFEFAAMDFLRPDKNRYQYKLEGFDREWIQSGTVHSATYTNLDPGTYTFHVKGSNSDGVWSTKSSSIKLVILPPWYMTWWFRLLLAVTVIGAVYIFYRYRLQQALKLHAIRNKIASDLHDEIGSNLSSISIFSDVAKEQSEGQPVSPLLTKISNYTQESMEAMSDIVWMINAKNDRFENIIIRMRELAVELIETQKCSLHLDIDEQLNAVKMDMQERKNFWLIYKEALNNIAKYAGASNVWIKLSYQHKTVHLVIEDDGVGFDTGITRSGNGLGNMQQRAKALGGELEIESTIGKGSKILLQFKI